MIRVLFVCLGNICRSPLAQGIFRKLVAEQGLQDRIDIDSAGTGGWHVGQTPDRRMRATAEANGVSLHGITARQVEPADLRDFDYIFAMDRQNYADLVAVAGRESASNIRLFRDFDPVDGDRDVPDPYYGGSDGFTRVFEIVDRTNRAVLAHICKQHDLPCSDGSIES